jgi:hypothetical protein
VRREVSAGGKEGAEEAASGARGDGEKVSRIVDKEEMEGGGRTEEGERKADVWDPRNILC